MGQGPVRAVPGAGRIQAVGGAGRIRAGAPVATAGAHREGGR